MIRNAVSFGLLLITMLLVTAAAIYSGTLSDASSQRVSSVAGEVSSTGPVIRRDKQLGAASDGTELLGRPAMDQPGSDADRHPLDPLLAYAREIREHLESQVADYTATMVKRERINGRLGSEARMLLKVRNRRVEAADAVPLSCYIKFVEPASTRDREVIWVEGRNDNRLISHEGGFLNLKRFELEPSGTLAMLGNKYPITEIGLVRLVEKLIEKGERDRQLGDCQVEIVDGQSVGGRACRLLQVTHPQPDAGFDFHIAQIFVDVERQIPLRYAAFLWPQPGEEPPLEEEYMYLDVQLNVGLTDEDFDPENAAYRFP